MEKAKGKRQKAKVQVKIKNFKFLIVLLPFTFLFFTLFGCAAMREGGRWLIGISTKELEEGRKQALTRTVSLDYNSCYKKALEALKKMEAYIYAKNKDMIAVYLSAEDTTPVGLFFKEKDASSTQIEFSSPSTYAKELISAKVFSALEGNADEEK